MSTGFEFDKVTHGIAFSAQTKHHLGTSGETSPTFGHANANFSVFIDRKRNQFLKK